MSCACLEALMSWKEIPGQKGRFKFIDAGYIYNLARSPSENGSFKPVLRAMKETPQGRLTLQTHWLAVRFCPVCGTEVEEWKEGKKDEART